MKILNVFCTYFSGNEFVVLKTPSFAESISEGDVRWDKGEYILLIDNSIRTSRYIYINH